MRCEQVWERMWDVDGVRQMEAHIATCPRCAAEWQLVQQFERELATITADAPSARFTDHVMARVAKEPPLSKQLSQQSHATESQRQPMQANDEPSAAAHRPSGWTWSTLNHLWVASAATYVFMLGGRTFVDDGSGLPLVAVYSVRLGRAIADMVGWIPSLF
ncbi:anti-sigma factor family protein [Numidum massiliense]|uniref:anti-sigma factor family protein n=1 Tax=Numidum massiliense TaxID=1522315 RepID=UPI0006D536B6|nr:zf-HC2 domain-containing protein [Numidum massiliense]